MWHLFKDVSVTVLVLVSYLHVNAILSFLFRNFDIVGASSLVFYEISHCT
jgi:hypothetical protein